MSMMNDDTMGDSAMSADDLFNSLVSASPEPEVVSVVGVAEPEVVETSLVVGGVVIPNEDSPLPPADTDSDDSDDSEDEEDSDEDEEVSARFVFPNRKKPDPADKKKFRFVVEVPVEHEYAEKTAKRITSIVRSKVRDAKDAIKTSDAYKTKTETEQKAMLSGIKVSSAQVIADLFNFQPIIDTANKFVADAQGMEFAASTPDRVRNSVKAAKEQAAIAYKGMVCAFLQYGMDAVTLYHQLKKLKIDSDSAEVQGAITLALTDPDFGNKSEEEAAEFLTTFKSQTSPSS